MISLPVLALATLSLWIATDPDSVPRVWPSREIVTPRPAWVRVPAGTLRPLFPASPDEREVRVDAFDLAELPTTNAEFLWFVSSHPEWQRGNVSGLFADRPYLEQWRGPTSLGSASPAAPVTNVSWFAARAYCRALGSRLPTELEWQRAGAASRTRADGRDDAAWSRQILEWYAEPSHGPERDVGQEPGNYFGLRDMHGLVWEWVLDFNSTLITSDSRNPSSSNPLAFCGAGARAVDPDDYAGFMRVAFLSSLRANRVTRHLGFRCARDVRKEAP